MEKTFIIDVNGVLLEFQVRVQRIYASEAVRRELCSTA
jgi:hypothetical protein